MPHQHPDVVDLAAEGSLLCRSRQGNPKKANDGRARKIHSDQTPPSLQKQFSNTTSGGQLWLV
jgi:hypothetical protein